MTPSRETAALNANRPPLNILAEARQKTLASGSARIALSSDHTWQMPPMPRRRRGGLLRPLVGVAKATARRLWKRATGGFDWRHQEAEGIIDLAGRRYMLDYGSYAQLYAEGKQWHGRSGRALSTLPPETDVVPTPLWLLDLLLGVTEAQEVGTPRFAAPRVGTSPRAPTSARHRARLQGALRSRRSAASRTC
jgi:hypothetical protein